MQFLKTQKQFLITWILSYILEKPISNSKCRLDYPYKEHRFSVFGSKGSLIFDDTENWKNKLIFNPSYLNKKNEVVYKPNVSILIQEEPLKKEIESFLNCIQYGETPLTDIKEAINVQIVLNKIENKLIKKYG